MRVGNIHLLSYLGQREGRIIFFVREQLPDPCISMEKIAGAVFCSGTESGGRNGSPSGGIPAIEGQWTSLDFWTEHFGELKNFSGARCAVFISPLSSIPSIAERKLKGLGIEEIIYSDGGEWFHLGLESSGKTGRLAPLLQKAGACLRSVRLFIPKLILKAFSEDLRSSGTAVFSRDNGRCFLVQLPKFAESGDRSGDNRSRLAFFEEQTLLLPHQLHEIIRKIGSGAYAHWEHELYFSTTDNSDPNCNLRRYRLINVSGKLAWIRFFLWIFPKAKLLPKFQDDDDYDPSFDSFPAAPAAEIGIWDKKGVRITGTRLKIEREVRRIADEDPPRGIQLTTGRTAGISMFIGSLAAGGSERQLSYLVRGLAARGAKVKVLSKKITDPSSMHYFPVLEQAGVEHSYYDSVHPDFNVADQIRAGDLRIIELMEFIPPEFSREVFAAYSQIIVDRPRIVHCWLDSTNIIGGIAALLAGVDKIILSTRSFNPSMTPHLCFDWFKPWYRILARSRRVSFIANSSAGAQSYADWLKIPRQRFQVIYNGLDYEIFSPVSPDDVARFRHSLGIEGKKVVLGVLRLSAEKCPLLLVEAVAQLVRDNPDVVGLHVGEGVMQREMEEAVARFGLQNKLLLLGRRQDIPLIMSASDLLMLTSYVEGFPNVLMEAQSLGCPVISTRVGGAPEVVVEGKTGFLAQRNDPQDLAAKAAMILSDDALRSEMSRNGRSWVFENFSVEKMIDRTAAFYGQAGGGLTGRPIFDPQLRAAGEEDSAADRKVANGIGRVSYGTEEPNTNQ